jgi:DNA-binding transcriptional regulator YiaG
MKGNLMARKKTPPKPSTMRDPMLQQVLEIFHGSDMSAAKVAEKSGISVTTIRNWNSGKTMRPQNITMEFALRAMGYKRVIVKQ